MIAISLVSLMLTAHVQAAHTFKIDGDRFLLDGKPFHIRCGEMHYARVPREYWRDRFKKLKAMGLNTVCTYAFWNLHEPQPGKYDFSGNNDIKEFVKEAQEEGLWVLLRPGPYSCAEWEWGGFPYWLARTPGMKVRTKDPRFLKDARDYLKHLGGQLSPMQITHGGPILMVQVENEYGSFGHDLDYKSAIKKDLQDGGFDTVFYTADGPSDGMLNGGTLPGVFASVNFGGDPSGAFKEQQKFRPGSPKMCGEYYPGWFDSWGKPHAHTSTQGLADDVEWMESNDCSYSLYMVHGGTTFGFMNGANWYDNGYWPQTTSYDYSTTIDEAGRPTEKFYAFQKVIKNHLAPGETLPDLPAPLPVISIPQFSVAPVGSAFDLIAKPQKFTEPPRFEQLGQPYGYVLYRTTLTQPSGKITFEDLQDRAEIFVDGGPVSAVMRGNGPVSADVDAPEGARVDILVENMGRINYGGKLLGEHKGLGPVQGIVGPWEVYKLPFDRQPTTSVEPHTVVAGVPTLFKGSFNLTDTGDTYLDMRGWGKGVVWVNGHNLGRFWHIGPQQTMFLPGCWLHKGANEIYIWDTDTVRSRGRTIKGVTDPIFELEAKQ